MAVSRVKVNNALGQNLRRIRRSRGWSLREAVEKIGVEISNPYLCQIEKGYVKSPSITTAKAIATAYEISLEQIAEWISLPPVEHPTCPTCGQELEDTPDAR